MMKKSFFIKTFTFFFTSTVVLGALTYSSERFEPKKIDFSAFRNASANIKHISQKKEMVKDEKFSDITSGIVGSIEKEVKKKIIRSRYALKPKISDIALSGYHKAEPEFEINNKELIKLYGYEVKSLAYATFSNTKIALIESQKQFAVKVENLEEDSVNAVLASTQKRVADETISEKKESLAEDELVMFDYSAKKEVFTEAPKFKKTFDGHISDSVKNAIERAVHNSPKMAMNTQKNAPSNATTAVNLIKTESDELEKVMSDEDNIIYDYSTKTQAAVKKSSKQATNEAISAFLSNSNEKEITPVEFSIKALDINLSNKKIRQVFGFEFVPDYDRADRADDQATGEIKLGYSLSSDMTTQTGIVQAYGLIPTRVELNLLNKEIKIPLLSEAGVQKFLSKKQTEVTGNLLMVSVDSGIADVEIDTDYQYKLFFSNKFKMLENKENAAFILFLGVKTGNTLLRYLLSNKESAQKIVYVGDGEMYFEDAAFETTQRELYTFTTRSLLGKKVKELNIRGEEISFFGTKTVAKKKAINAYEIKVPELVENSRKYLEFKHTGKSLFVGTKNTKDIEIPSDDFIARVMQVNELSELGERCMVQINLKKDIRNIKISGKNRSGEMFAETSFLDNDGNFSRDNSELAEKIFVTGDLEGIFSARLDYSDGSTDFLKTFCSEGSYLVEQL